MNSMSQVELEVALSVGLAVGIAVCLEVGFRVGKRYMQRDPESAHEGIGAIEGSVFALLGLLLAFSYAGATDRLVFRRNLIMEEANRIGVAYLRLDLLPATEQPDLRRLFRDYLDARVRHNSTPGNVTKEIELCDRLTGSDHRGLSLPRQRAGEALQVLRMHPNDARVRDVQVGNHEE